MIAIALDHESLDALRAHAVELGVTLEATEPASGLRALEEGAVDVDAVVVGEVPDPIRTAQRTHLAAPDVPVVLVGSDADCRSMSEALRFTPLVGTEVRCLPVRPSSALLAGVRNAVERVRRRRSFRQTIGVLNRKLADSGASVPPATAGFLGRLLDVAPIGIAVADERGLVRAVNARGAQLLGRPERGLIGSPVWEPFGAPHDEGVRGLLRRLDEDPAGQPREVVEARLDDGRAVKLELTGARLNERSGGPGYLVVIQDTTERVDLVAQLESANRRKDEFLAMLGHELRNPLAPIKTAVELMRLRGQTGSERERGIIERQVNHLVQLVDDLLDVSRITRGKLTLHRRVVEIPTVVAEAIEMASPLLEERQHDLRVDVPREGLHVHGDPSRLAQVLANLLTNAAKYTDTGGKIFVTARREGGDVALAVRDTGRGIDPSLLPQIFDLFVQGRQSLDRSSGGLGIGLTIVRSLVELHGGRISATSELGVGTEFVVHLPAVGEQAGAASSSETVRAAAPRRAPGDAVRVLVVDDNRDAAMLLGELLETLGYAIEVAFDGPSALALASRFRPDVALLDIGLPVMDGYELGARLRARAGLEDVRLIAVTGYGQETDRARSRAAGFVDHLVKPIHSDAVRNAVERLGLRRPRSS